MKKGISYLIILLSFSLYSQNNSKDTIYILINTTKNKNLFIFEKNKNNQYATIKVFDYNKNKQEKTNKLNKIYPKPSSYNFTNYYSINQPKHIASIIHLKTLSIEDLSKNQNKIINNQIIIFVEKLNSYSYNLWTMKLAPQE